MPVSLSAPFQLRGPRSPQELCRSSGMLGTAGASHGTVTCGWKAERSHCRVLLTATQRWQGALGQLCLSGGPRGQKTPLSLQGGPELHGRVTAVMPPSEGRPTDHGRTSYWNNSIRERTNKNKGNVCFLAPRDRPSCSKAELISTPTRVLKALPVPLTLLQSSSRGKAAAAAAFLPLPL